MSNTKTVMGQASNQYVVPPGPDVTDVFSTYLYDGTGSAQTITNGIDLAGEGGLVWIKDRSTTEQHVLTNTERGATKFVKSNSNGDEQTNAQALTSFNSNGFSIGNYADVNQNTDDFASWTFRKAPKFFDVVTWTGDGVAGRTVSHNLGAVPGAIFIKRTDTSRDWMVYHRGLNGGVDKGHYTIILNSANAQVNSPKFNDTEPTDSLFSLNDSSTVNASGGTYVAYIFAHNNNDGGFGPTGDQDIIKCGSYTGNGSNDGLEIDLGFEPQWVLVKGASSGAAYDWFIWDNIRGMDVNRSGPWLRANLSNAEGSNTGLAVGVTSTGFNAGNDANTNGSGETYIYMAIRRGPLAAPTAGTEVFAIDTLGGTSPNPPDFYSGWPVDMSMHRRRSQSANWLTVDRLRGPTSELRTNSTEAEQSIADVRYDQMTGYYDDSNVVSDIVSWMWKRAPGYFDVVAYTGVGTAGRTVSHNLGVEPEMMWVKGKNYVENWGVYHKDVGATKYLMLNQTSAEATYTAAWNDTAPTSSVFTLGGWNAVNESGYKYIAYLFASLDGISKVGSFSHTNGADTTVDCGFSSGARFVVVKMSSSADHWFVYDTVRGINAGTEPYLTLNTNSNEATGTDQIDPTTSGFVWTSGNNTGDYIFYAIA